MSVEAEALEDWVGTEVVDAAGERLGKVSDVHYVGDEPVVIEIRSGLTGRKHHVAALNDAKVSKTYVRIESGELIPSRGGIDAEALDQLAAQDERLRGIAPEDLEGGQARSERRRAAHEALGRASQLEDDAAAWADAAKQASAEAADAHERAQRAELNRRQTATAAEDARRQAENLLGRESDDIP